MTPRSGDSGMSATSAAVTYRFGEFEVDVAAYELRRAAVTAFALARQPMDLLLLLLERRQELVSREDIAKRLWSPDVFTDLDAGIRRPFSRSDKCWATRASRHDSSRPCRERAIDLSRPSSSWLSRFRRCRPPLRRHPHASARRASPQPAGRAHELRRTAEGAPRIARGARVIAAAVADGRRRALERRGWRCGWRATS